MSSSLFLQCVLEVHSLTMGIVLAPCQVLWTSAVQRRHKAEGIQSVNDILMSYVPTGELTATVSCFYQST